MLVACLVGALLAAATAAEPSARTSAPTVKRCKIVVKKVRVKKSKKKKTKRVRVCKVVPSPTLVRADLSLSAAASADSIVVGQDLEYSVTVRNAGPQPARNVILAIETPIALASLKGTAPDGRDVLPCPTDKPVPEAFRCLLGELQAGGTWELRFVGVPEAGGELRFAAAVRSATIDPTTTDTTAVVLTTAVDPPPPPPPPPPA